MNPAALMVRGILPTEVVATIDCVRLPGQTTPLQYEAPLELASYGSPRPWALRALGSGGATSQPDCRGGAVGDSSPKLRGETMKPKLEGLRIGQGRASDPVFIAQNLGNFGQNYW